MIRHYIRPADWKARIQASNGTWFQRTAERTATFAQLGKFQESSSIWSQIKRVYMELQGFKCGFCERRLEKSDWGNVEHDVEHFRPKGQVAAWQPWETTLGNGTPLGGPDPTGYFLLAYHHENYLISCKTCNTALKGSAFPVGAARQVPGTSPRDMKGEKPYLIYPLGAVDKDPEKLITFDGVLPIPIAASGIDRKRALITIDFLGLDRREGLIEERVESILALHLALEVRPASSPSSRALAEWLIDRAVSDAAPHASCARSHRRLFEQDPARATAIAAAALEYLLDRLV